MEKSELKKRGVREAKTVEVEATTVTGVEKKSLGAKVKTWGTRTAAGFAMAGALFLSLYMGHLVLAAEIVVLMGMSYKELLNVRRVHSGSDGEVPPGQRRLAWSVFGTVAALFVCLWLRTHFAEDLARVPYLRRVNALSPFCCFAAYMALYVAFVLRLQESKYRAQYLDWAWMHMVLAGVVLPSALWLHNCVQGLFWFFVPASFVIANDTFAFFSGSLFGKTPLIKLSPKKTWEGFVGGAICTYLWALFITTLLSNYEWFTCPKTSLFAWAVAPCEVPSVFLLQDVALPEVLGSLGLPAAVRMKPIHLHMFVFATFANLVAPFGGFFMSGLKRAFNAKDFDNLIPGHGGITDRIDCQILMGAFTYFYTRAFIFPQP